MVAISGSFAPFLCLHFLAKSAISRSGSGFFFMLGISRISSKSAAQFLENVLMSSAPVLVVSKRVLHIKFSHKT